MGNRKLFLENALTKLREQVSVLKVSPVYETEAWGNTQQQSFLNQAIEIETQCDAQTLLQIMLSIETEMGRNRTEKWAPREIDLDILFFNDAIIETKNLSVPHPFLHQRKFALIPLVFLQPTLMHPVLKKSVLQLLNECTDISEVKTTHEL